MTRSVSLALSLSALLLLSAGLGCGAASKAKGRPGSKNGRDAELPPVPVTVETVGRAAVRRTLVLSGSVQPQSQARIFTKVAGRIEELGADTCDEVSEKDVAGGRVLISLDHKLQDALLRQAEAAENLAVVALADAKRDVERAEDLFKTGVVNLQARDKAQAARDLAAAQLAQAKAAVAAAKASLDETKVLATIPGTVTQRSLDKGDFANPGQPLFTIQDLRTVKVLASVPQADLPLLAPGQSQARVTVEGVEGVFNALVTKVEPALDAATLSAPIELNVRNRRRAAPAGAPTDGKACAPPWVLASGMSARIELVIEERKDAPVLPLEAVRNDGKKDFVFVVSQFEMAVAISASDQELKAEDLTATATSAGRQFGARVVSLGEPQALKPANGDSPKQVPAASRGRLAIVQVDAAPRDGGEPVAVGSEFTVQFGAKDGKVVFLAPLGLAPDGAGAAPYRLGSPAARRVDVKLGKLGAARGELGWLVELLDPQTLLGQRVVTEGVTRLTDGSRIQVVGNDGEASKPAPAAKDAAAPAAAPAEKKR